MLRIDMLSVGEECAQAVMNSRGHGVCELLSSRGCRVSVVGSQRPATGARGFADSPGVSDIFRGIADWPSLPQLLHAEAVRVLDADGITGWIRRGGRMRRDGLLTFSRASTRFFECVTGIVTRSRGFWDLDEAGVWWVVCPSPIVPEIGPWPCWAVSYAGDPELLDPVARRCYRSMTVGGGLSSGWADGVDRLILRAQDLDRALDLAEILVDAVDGRGGCVLQPAGRHCGSAQELIRGLSELSRLALCAVDLRPSDEATWLQRRSSVVEGFELLDGQRIAVRTARDLGFVLEQFRG